MGGKSGGILVAGLCCWFLVVLACLFSLYRIVYLDNNTCSFDREYDCSYFSPCCLWVPSNSTINVGRCSEVLAMRSPQCRYNRIWYYPISGIGSLVLMSVFSFFFVFFIISVVFTFGDSKERGFEKGTPLKEPLVTQDQLVELETQEAK